MNIIQKIKNFFNTPIKQIEEKPLDINLIEEIKICLEKNIPKEVITEDEYSYIFQDLIDNQVDSFILSKKDLTS